MTLLDLFDVNQSSRTFILKSYLPQVKEAFSNVKISPPDKLTLFLGTTATIGKLLYAFLFQEQTFMIDLLSSPSAIQVSNLN